MTSRRQFITLLGGAAAAWPVAARGQQGERMRRIGVLLPQPPTMRKHQARIAAFLQGLQQLGWTDGRNLRIDTRWAAGDADAFASMRRNWSRSPRTSSWLWQRSPCGRCCRRPAPCRSCSPASPIRSAPASSTAWRGRAATPPASLQFEYSLSGKWLELLKQIAPGVTRVAVLRDPSHVPGSASLPSSRPWRRRSGWR